eukprot:2543893-Rhodomonas_salina.6
MAYGDSKSAECVTTYNTTSVTSSPRDLPVPLPPVLAEKQEERCFRNKRSLLQSITSSIIAISITRSRNSCQTDPGPRKTKDVLCIPGYSNTAVPLVPRQRLSRLRSCVVKWVVLTVVYTSCFSGIVLAIVVVLWSQYREPRQKDLR